jgi:hypothetical protein
VDYSADGFDVYVSNFSNLECLGGGFATCDQPFGGSYWVSVVDGLLGTIDANELVGGRTTDVLRLWDDKVAVVSLTPLSQIYVFDGTASAQPVATIDVGYERPNHLTADRDGKTIFVGFDSAGTTCGLGLIEASDPDPALWSFERLDPSVGCARFVPEQ